MNYKGLLPSGGKREAMMQDSGALCWRRIAAISGFTAVAMGAVGAHAVGDAYLAGLVEKASNYQLLHSLLLLWLCGRDDTPVRWSRRFALAGIVLFCGSLYLKALTGWAQVTAAAPAGGSCFMATWLALAFLPRGSGK